MKASRSVYLFAVGASVACAPSTSFDSLEPPGDGPVGRVRQSVVYEDLHASSVVVGQMHACAHLDDGAVACWGSNTNGQLGIGSVSPAPNPLHAWPMRVVASLGTVTGIGAGLRHTCATKTGGVVRCWGSNTKGQVNPLLANGNPPPGCAIGTSCGSPVDVSGVTGALVLDGGGDQTCALRASDVLCWGRALKNLLGGPGDGWPTPVDDLGGATSLSAGSLFSCATTSSARVRCWSQRPTSTGWSVLHDTYTMGTGTKVAVGARHACAIREDGTVWCWGDSRFGQTGIVVPQGALVPDPIQVPGVAGATEIVAGEDHVCVLLASGDVRCWGGNSHGEIGIGTTSVWELPSSVSFGGLRPSSLSASGRNTCAVVSGGLVYCWGDNEAGQVGVGATNAEPVTPPRRVRWATWF